MAQAEPLFEYLLRLGDNCLVLGHRLSEWCGRAPARFWLTLAGEVEGQGRDADQLAYLRESRAFHNLLLVEQKNGDFAVTMTRQFFFDAWHWLLLDRLQHSDDTRIAEIAAKAIKEVTYHLGRSRDWIVRLGDGTEESHRRAQAAVDRLWVYTGELFEADEVDHAIGIDLTALRQPWLDLLGRTLAEATLDLPDPDAWMQKGGKCGLHTEQLGYLLAEMQSVHRAHPGATW
jgi:ring-1,2-phenylacetyl-CoA epoxidase subunit PaaC